MWPLLASVVTTCVVVVLRDIVVDAFSKNKEADNDSTQDRLIMEENVPAISSPQTTSNHDKNPKITVNPSKTREEGELSSSRNDEFAGSRVPDGTILPPALFSKRTSVVEKGVNALPLNSVVASRTTVHPNKRKGPEKNRVPFVISFSDDDSDSDSEEYENESAMKSDETTCGALESRKVSTSTVNSRSQMGQPIAKTSTTTPKSLSTNRTFVSSVNRVIGTKFKNSGSTSVGAKTHPIKYASPSIIKFGQNVQINNNKLQDLRQLIAIRENELKNKVGKLDNDVATTSKKNNTDVNLKSAAIRTKSFPGREPKEQEMKRLKVNEPLGSAMVSIGQRDRPPLESTVMAGVGIAVGQQDRSPTESTVAAGVANLLVNMAFWIVNMACLHWKMIF